MEPAGLPLQPAACRLGLMSEGDEFGGDTPRLRRCADGEAGGQVLPARAVVASRHSRTGLRLHVEPPDLGDPVRRIPSYRR
ncbi:hypothetical protein C3488_31785 [Streptomyces sp. Ru72]|nr:hypothetical protein C3488_31785 [Streptomyces sp. Ru72]